MQELRLKPGQEFCVGDTKITVEECRFGSVKLAIDYPVGVTISVPDYRPPVAEAACNVRGLSEADYEHKRYMAGQDEEVLIRRMEDERDEDFGEGIE